MGAPSMLGRPRPARRLVVLGLALLAASATAAIAGAATARADFSSPQIIAALNRQRTANGIPPVRNDAAMAAGCAAYDRYVVRNGLSVADHHYEDPRLPGYTAAGDHAARTSVLAYGTGVVFLFGPPIFSIGWSLGDPWNSAAFHLFQMMNPALSVSGANELTARLRDGEWVRLECLNTVAGPFRTPPVKLRAYFYPRSGATGSVFTRNQESEPVLGVSPGADGPPLTFGYFFGRRVDRVRVSMQATLNGKTVPVRTVAVGGAIDPTGASAAALERPLVAGSRFSSPGPSGSFISPIPAMIGMPDVGPWRDIARKLARDRQQQEEQERWRERIRDEQRPYLEKNSIPYSEKVAMSWLMGLASSPGPTGGR
ncbi:MAG: hypothetical protein ACYCXW_03595 [Solirubrobacteraceae bacterium]